MLDVKPCMDPSLPEGHAFWLALHSQPQGLFFIAGAVLRGSCSLKGCFPCCILYSLRHASPAVSQSTIMVHPQTAARTQRGGWMGC